MLLWPIVHHWGILRIALPTKIQIVCVICLANCLAHLHNFSIDEEMQCGQSCCTDLLPEDRLHLIFGHGGCVQLVNTPQADIHVPVDLILGENIEDIPQSICRRQ